MYAVFEDGSRQYTAREGEVVKVDYRDVEDGARLEFGRVLLYSNADDLRIGQPTVAGMRVVGEVVDFPSTKLVIQKYRRRKNYRRKKGHRQWYTAVKVSHILLPGQEAPPPAPKPEKKPAEPTAEKPAETPAAPGS